MGFVSGPVSFQRFVTTSSIPTEISEEFVAAVGGRAFGRTAATADGLEVGWVGPRHLFETDISAQHIAFGRFALLGLRIDRAKVPANVLKSYIRMEEDVALETSGREFLSKAEKRRARDAALARADQELRSGAFRRMNSYPVLIDLEYGVVYCGALGAAVGDRLMQLFSDTFGAGLEPATPERVAARLLTARKNARALETLTPFRLGRPPRGLEADQAGNVSTDQNWLGKELLSWLWYQAAQADGGLRVKSGDEITVMLDRTLRLKCDYGITGVDAISADGPTNLPESRAALAIGKQPVKAGLVLGSPMGEVRLTLDALRFTVSGAGLPDEQVEGDHKARLEHRFEQIADTANLLDALFDVFLQHRCSRQWSTELKEMSAWAAGQAPAALLRAAL